MDRGQKILIAKRCHDSDTVPKVSNAGTVIDNDGSRPYQIMHNGIKVYTDSHYGDSVTKLIQLLRGHCEPQKEKVFYETLKNIPLGGTMLELGSLGGYYSMWFAVSMPDSRNFIVGPWSEGVQNSIDNFKLNNLAGDFTVACVGRESLEKNSYKHSDGKFYEVDQISIDDFLTKRKIGSLAILHSDIQNAELEILKGASKSLKYAKINVLFISTHTESLHYQCINLLKRNSYDIVSEHTKAESFSTDGLIVAAHSSLKISPIKVSKRISLLGIMSRIGYFIKG
jgi:FkbM family methyltransferase